MKRIALATLATAIAACSVPDTAASSLTVTVDACNRALLPTDASVDAAPDARVDARPIDAAPPPPDAQTYVTGRKLIIALHGVGSSGPSLAALLNVSAYANSETIILTPTGVHNLEGVNSWPASHACCDDLPNGGDPNTVDTTSLTAYVQSAIATYHPDPHHTYLYGYSNGAFMAYREICEHPELFAGAFLQSGGANSAHDAPCTPSQHVPMILAHGTADVTVHYFAPNFVGSHMQDPQLTPIDTAANQPSACGPYGCLPGEWQQAANFNGCTGTLGLRALSDYQKYDHDTLTWKVSPANAPKNNNLGAETTVLSYSGCPADGTTEVWKMEMSPHDITFSPSYLGDIITRLEQIHR